MALRRALVLVASLGVAYVILARRDQPPAPPPSSDPPPSPTAAPAASTAPWAEAAVAAIHAGRLRTPPKFFVPNATRPAVGGGLRFYDDAWVEGESDEASALRAVIGRIDAAAVDELEMIVHAAPVWLKVENASTLERRWAGRPGKVRIACLYAGFVRDFERMIMSCPPDEKCTQKHRRKYGHQREHLLRPSKCDIFVSTWDIRGRGRYNTHWYNTRDAVAPASMATVLGEGLAGLHVQNYTAYAALWVNMSRTARLFPQSRPTPGATYRGQGWYGTPEVNYFLRMNDYSQAYKHWCVARLALLSGMSYDVFFRLRFDVRMLREIRFLPRWGGSDVRFLLSARIGERGTWTNHSVGPQRIHVANFDISDFGFIGTPTVVGRYLASLWAFCLQPPSTRRRPTHIDGRPGNGWISEYNLMLWRIVFDLQLHVDSGNVYLRISRNYS